ncbi:glycosyltransferase, partial [Bacillus sp. JJ1566]|uniref:glycosyltransferase n=1 Tax=Bacillus sp. JJ1566 TaxID=3122961 RepID=UPI002FFF5B77
KVDKPVVWTLHDCWPFTGHCAYFDYVNCNKWITGCENCPQKNSYPASSLRDNSKNNYLMKKNLFNGVKNLTIVTPSEWLANIVKKSFIKSYPVEVINNGIDLNVFKPTSSTFRESHGLLDKFILLGVANVWDKRKGLEYFLEISKKLKDDEIIVLVGLKDQQIKSLPKNIIGISKTDSPHELAQIYSACDIFINPTLEDNFPTTNLEALACGTPIITFNTGGSVESVDEDCGFVVTKGAIKEILEKKDIIKEKGKHNYFTNCINKSINNYDKNDKFAQYIELYKKVIS